MASSASENASFMTVWLAAVSAESVGVRILEGQRKICVLRRGAWRPELQDVKGFCSKTVEEVQVEECIWVSVSQFFRNSWLESTGRFRRGELSGKTGLKTKVFGCSCAIYFVVEKTLR
jgi:hypothetical protein